MSIVHGQLRQYSLQLLHFLISDLDTANDIVRVERFLLKEILYALEIGL